MDFFREIIPKHNTENERIAEPYAIPTSEPPQLPHPWRAQWDDREARYIYFNPQTGERSVEVPGHRPTGSSYGLSNDRTLPQEEPEEKHGSHGMLYGGLGAAAGLAGGAFLAHEAGEIQRDWDRDENRLEQSFVNAPENAAQWTGEKVGEAEDIQQGWDRDENRIEQSFSNAPEDAAEWTGEKVGEVEDIPQDVEQGLEGFGDRVEGGWDGLVGDVEGAPEAVAGWVGGEVEGVERFGDRVDGAYDEGRAEGRDDGGW